MCPATSAQLPKRRDVACRGRSCKGPSARTLGGFHALSARNPGPRSLLAFYSEMASFGTDRLGVDLLWVDDTVPPPGADDLLLPGSSLPGGGGHHTSHDLDFLGGLGGFEVDLHTRLHGGADGTAHGHGDTTSDMLSYLSASPTAASADFLGEGGPRGGNLAGWRCLEACHQPCLKCVPLACCQRWGGYASAARTRRGAAAAGARLSVGPHFPGPCLAPDQCNAARFPPHQVCPSTPRGAERHVPAGGPARLQERRGARCDAVTWGHPRSGLPLVGGFHPPPKHP